jgi:hypothetical protein
MSSLVSFSRSVRRRSSPPVLAIALAALVLCGSVVGSAFGVSPAKLVSEALKEAKTAEKNATKAQASAKSAEKAAKTADADATTSAVGTARIQDGAVTSTKLAAGSVGPAQLAAGSVGPAQVAAGAVGPDQLAAGAVGTAAIADGAVTGAKLTAGSVGSAQIAPGSVTIQHLSGTSESTTFSLPAVAGSTCSTAEISDPGAATTDFPMVSFPGPTNLPLQVSATPLKVDVAGSVRVKFCNGTATDAAVVSGVNVEVITLR